jgi:ABC-2 type transport system permease protein
VKLIKLVGVAIKGVTGFSKASLLELKQRDLLWVLPLAVTGILVVLTFIVFYVVNLYHDLILVGIQIGKPELIFFYAILGSWIFIFLTGIPLALSMMYYSRDIGLLLSLPLHPLSIITSRLILLLLYALPINLLIIVPAVTIYAVGISISFELIIAGLIHVIIGPLFPLSLAMLFVVGLAKIVNLGRYKTAFEVGGMFFALAMILVVQIVISRSVMNPSGLRSITDLSHIFGEIMEILFPVYLAARSFFPGYGFLFLFLSLGLSGILLTIMLFTAKLNFIADYSRRIVVTRKKGKNGRDAFKTRTRDIVITLLSREWHVLLSNSSFIFQAFGELCIVPILLIIGLFAIPKEMLAHIVEGVSSFAYTDLVVFGICVIITTWTSLTSTSISREGNTFALNLLIPVPGRKHMIAKMLLHLQLYVPVFIVDLIILSLLFNIPFHFLLYMIPGGCAFLLLSFIAHMYIDLVRPVLTWTHPMQAVKNNINVLVGMGVSLAYCSILGLISFFLIFLFSIPSIFLGAGLVIVVTVVDLILLHFLFAFADRRYGGELEIV